jgi:hypothetical protein
VQTRQAGNWTGESWRRSRELASLRADARIVRESRDPEADARAGADGDLRPRNVGCPRHAEGEASDTFDLGADVLDRNIRHYQPPMLVVLDTNAFHGDVRADRGRLRAIIDGALAKGAFELFVPEVVLQELDKQFAQRSRKVVKDINKALGDRETELRELGLTGPPPMALDDDDVAGYCTALEARITQAGGRSCQFRRISRQRSAGPCVAANLSSRTEKASPTS